MNKADAQKMIGQFEKDLENLPNAYDFYDLEEKVACIVNQIALKILESEIGAIGKDRRKKKAYCPGLE